MLNKDTWSSYLPEVKMDKKYLLVYQLHNEHDNANFDEAVKSIAKEKNLEIVRITYSYSDLKIGKKIVLPQVFEFLSLIKNAEFIVTDSFHGTAFSINFNKQMAIIYPKKFSTRMDNILSLTGLSERRYTSADKIGKWNNVIDYEPVNKILDAKRSEINNRIDEWCENGINM